MVDERVLFDSWTNIFVAVLFDSIFFVKGTSYTLCKPFVPLQVDVGGEIFYKIGVFALYIEFLYTLLAFKDLGNGMGHAMGKLRNLFPFSCQC